MHYILLALFATLVYGAVSAQSIQGEATAGFKVTTDFSKPVNKAAAIKWDCQDSLNIRKVMPQKQATINVAGVPVSDTFLQGVTCETKEVVISLNGRGYRLNSGTKEREFKGGFHRSYESKSEEIAVNIKPVKVLKKLVNFDTECTEYKRLVEVDIQFKGAKQTLQAVIDGGCP
jgi:hypothetical protein